MTPETIAARLADADALARSAPTRDSSFDLNEASLIAAAVLVPIVLHPQPSILLTLRAARLSAHAGQVAFPGGRLDPGETPEQAALREAEEEVGLDRRLPRLIGRLPDHMTGTGYRVTPVVGLIDPPMSLTPHPGEVEEAFELPLSVVLDPTAPQRRKSEFKGRAREFWVWPHEKHYIWGASAAMLVNLARVLRP